MNFSLSLTLRAFLIMVCIFILHRFMALPFLNSHIHDSNHLVKSFLVGCMSDVWVATLGSLIILFMTAPFRNKALAVKLYYAFLTLIIMATAGHQAYVMFFHHPMLIAHLEYLYDFNFIQANGSSFVNISSLLILTSGIFLTYYLQKKHAFTQQSLKVKWSVLLCIILIATASHISNLMLRHNWFVPDSMRANGFEHLYMAFVHRQHHEPLSPLELVQLNEALLSSRQSQAPVEHLKLVNSLDGLLTGWKLVDSNINDIGRALKEQWKLSITNHKKPLLILLTLESLRSVDTGYINSGTDSGLPSLTPHLDELAESGIAFTNAFSTSVVTRGAQEALLCGYPGNQNASLMRTFNHWQYTCLFDAVKNRNNEATTFWLHGGEGLFDNQQVFWSKHHTDVVLTKADFAENTPQTGWGISDMAFVEMSAKVLQQIHQDSKQYSVGMMLSITNHPPWILPSDAAFGHSIDHLQPHHRTVAYSDAAIGQFIRKLRDDGLWDQSLIFITGDHGHSLTAYYPPAPANEWSEGILKSKVPFVITGGITERATKAFSKPDLVTQDFVNHLDISAYISWLLDVEGFSSFGEGLFLKHSAQPKFTDIGNGVYFPHINIFMPYHETSQQSGVDLPTQNHSRYFRAFLDWIAAKQS